MNEIKDKYKKYNDEIIALKNENKLQKQQIDH